MKPTLEAYQAFQTAYDFFNKELFMSELPRCLITLQRQRASYGYFCKDRFASRTAKTDEIALNPQYLRARSDIESLSTLVHEMVHLWQDHFAKPGRGRYHNKQWADKMESLGLMPSDTGKEGGKRVGDRMSHYIVAAGPYDKTAQSLLNGRFEIPWGDNNETAPDEGDGEEGSNSRSKNKSNRLKFSCRGCKVNAWGKPDLLLICGKCRVDMICRDAQTDGDK